MCQQIGQMDKFLETYKLPKLKQEELENLNTTKEIESVIKNSQKTKQLKIRTIGQPSPIP